MSSAGYDLIVAASWLPVQADPLRWRDGAGNTARVLRATVAERGGALIGCTARRPWEATLLDNVWLHPVALDEATADGFLHGHCERTISPLYHDNGPIPAFRSRWRDAYRRVNQRVADRITAAAAPGATVWIHDYQLQLVPGLLRARRPDVRIGFFLHSPFPSVERFLAQPLRTDIVDSLLAADLVGVQNERSAVNFADVADAVHPHRHQAPGPAVGVFPTSVDTTTIDTLARRADIRAAAATIRAELGEPRTVLLSIGAPEQADSSQRLLDAYAQLLADHRIDPARAVLVHVAVCGDDPSHLRCDRERLDRAIARINGTHGRIGRPAVGYVHREQSLPDIVALYLAADVMLALPLRDGMNLAAKEYLAARTDDTGRLVLSEFSGAAADLSAATLVNPYDTDAVSAAILAAIGETGPTAQVARMRADLRRHDAAAWAQRYLTALRTVTRYSPVIDGQWSAR